MLNYLCEILKVYGVIGSARLVRDLLLSRIFFPGARIVRAPFYVRGRSNISVGSNFTCGVGIRLDAFALSGKYDPQIVIGNDCEFNDYVHIGCIDRVCIGDNVLIASKVFISDHDHGEYSNESSDIVAFPSARPLHSKPIVIEDGVWLGEYVSVLAGVHIGKHSVIGAGSIVTKSIPPYSVVAGNPAKVLKKFDIASKKWVS